MDNVKENFEEGELLPLEGDFSKNDDNAKSI